MPAISSLSVTFRGRNDWNSVVFHAIFLRYKSFLPLIFHSVCDQCLQLCVPMCLFSVNLILIWCSATAFFMVIHFSSGRQEIRFRKSHVRSKFHCHQCLFPRWSSIFKLSLRNSLFSKSFMPKGSQLYVVDLEESNLSSSESTSGALSVLAVLRPPDLVS